MASERSQWLLHPYMWYRQMREISPVFRNADYGSWALFRYVDVERALSDHKAFSSQTGSPYPLGLTIINADPPRHRKLRSLVTQAFTPRTIAQLAPRIATITHELLDQVAAKGSMDIIDDLATPLPIIVIAELLGIPSSDRALFKRWSEVIIGTGGISVGEAQDEMAAYFSRLLEQRRREPQDDLVSALMVAEGDGETLSEDELFGFFVLLLVAGNITTTNLIGNAFFSFSEFPDALEQLYADRSLIPSALEEVLRYRSPVRMMPRVALAETALSAGTIPQGAFVVSWLGSANRDESVFPNPDTFDITRSPNRHVAFGHGIHFCLGAPLARLEAKIALEIMLERLPAMRAVPDVELEPANGFVLHGVRHFPITFEKG